MTNEAVPPPVSWDLETLFQAPEIYPAETEEPGLRAFFYESVPYQGKPTRVFAYYGVPENSEGKKLPAMVLVHGGAGSAYAEWVRQWTRRGYIAIAMDHFGNIPGRAAEGEPYVFDLPRNPDGGPNNHNTFAETDLPITDQWTYQAVAAVIGAHSLLRSFPEVDTERIGLTGISWGGYLTCIVASLDNRFKFAAPIYGCGFLTEDSGWMQEFSNIGEEKAARWNALWDPSRYLPNVRLPMLWINGTNDSAFTLNSWQKSTQLTQGENSLCIQIDMAHGQHEGAIPPEIHAYANSFFGLGKPLAKVGDLETVYDRAVKMAFQAEVPIVRAELNFTLDDGPWIKRKWETVAADSVGASAVTFKIPDGAEVFFVNLIDERGLIVSSEYVTSVDIMSE